MLANVFPETYAGIAAMPLKACLDVSMRGSCQTKIQVSYTPGNWLRSYTVANEVNKSPRNLSLHQLPQQHQRLLPPQITHLRRNHLRYPFLHDAHVGPDRHFLEHDRGLHLTRQVRVVELVGVDDAL